MKKVKYWLWAFLILLAASLTGLFYMPVKAAGDVVINSTNFPDDNFRIFITRFDSDGSGTLTAAEIKNIKEIDCSYKQISSLKGIEYFTALKSLDCDGNQLTSLDLSKNTALTWLECGVNHQLNSIDLSKNTKLTHLSCWGNGMTKLDVSKNTALTYLYCSSNQITSLSFSNNTELEKLDCSFNKLTKLDVSKNSKLAELNCTFNQLTGLNVSQNTALTSLSCSDNQLAKLDLSHNTKLKSLTCYDNNPLTTLDLSNNTALISLYCGKDKYSEDYKPMTKLDVSKNLALTTLSCWGAGLPELNVNKNTKLKELDCGLCQITFLDVSKNTALTSFSCTGNELTELDVSKNTALKSLTCSSNKLTKLDIRKNTALTYLSCGNNRLTELNVSNNTRLEELYCDYNSLTNLDVTKLEKLKTISCYWNYLTTLDVRNCKELIGLECFGNQISKLNLSKNTALKSLDCSSNPITNLDLSKNTALQSLSCGSTKLTSLDISKNTELKNLFCAGSQISTLNIKNNPYLCEVYNYGEKKEYDNSYEYSISSPKYYRLIVGKKVKISATEPLKPIPIKLSVVNGAVKITWDTYSKAARYQIYRIDQSGSWMSIGSTTDLQYTDSSYAKPGDPNTYIVIPISSDGKELAGYGDGTSISFTTDPVDITVANKAAGIKLNWSKVDNAAKYRIFRKTSGGSWEKLATTTSLNYTDKKAVYSETYIYSVRAMTAKGNYINKYGNGTKITRIVSAPKLTLTNVEEGIEISWSAMTDAAKYKVYVKNDSGKWTRLNTVSSTSYTDTTAVNGKTYTYSIIGCDASGNAMNENGDGYEIIRNDAFVKPKAESTTDGVLLSWDAFAGAAKYRVYRKDASGKWVKLKMVTELQYVDADATVNAKNVYAVLAVDGDNNVLTGYGKGKSIKFVIPSTPVGYTIKSASVRLDWSAVVQAEKYQVYRKTKSTDWAKLGTTTGLSYNDKTVESGKNYYYSVIAIDAKGKALNDYGEDILVKFRSTNVNAFAEVIPEELEGLGIAEETEAVVEEETTEEDEDVVDEETSEEEGSEEDVIEEETSEEESFEEDAIVEETSDEEGSEEDVIEEETSEEESFEEDAIVEETSDEEGSEEDVIEEETSESDATVINEDTVEEEILE